MQVEDVNRGKLIPIFNEPYFVSSVGWGLEKDLLS